MWDWAAVIVTVLVGTGTFLGLCGPAFWVGRPEYTSHSQADAVFRENMRGTLNRLDNTLNSQIEGFRVMTGEIQTMKIDLAVMKKNH